LIIRRTLEAIVDKYNGDRNAEEFGKFMTYTKRVWFCNGIHHHYSSDKFLPEFSQEYFRQLVQNSPDAKFPLQKGETVEQLLEKIIPVMFDAGLYPKRINLDPSKDLIASSACNFYENLTQHEVEKYYEAIIDTKNETPVSYGLNSKLVKEGGKIIEKPYKTGGLYSQAIEKIVYWLEQAKTVAENENQKAGLEKLIEYYNSGDLKTWDDYNVLWVKDLTSSIDYVNGFIEVYGDPLGMKATWESVVNFKDVEATKRAETISQNAQWFEDNSPVDPRFKKKEVKGVSAKVITVVQLGGDCHPSTPIGINLPNADWIRARYGSKSVTIGNLTEAYNQAAQGSGMNEEFVIDEPTRQLIRQYGDLCDDLHTDLHECLGHGSGQLLPGTSPDALKAYGSTIEEARADLFGLYYLADDKLVELGLTPNKEAYKSQYYHYMMNGLMTQLVRIKPGHVIEEAHMRNRALIARWCYAHGDGVVEMVRRDGKTYVRINDYERLRQLFARLLAEIQRVKSEGDYEAARQLVEEYGIKVDADLHKEVLERYRQLHIAPYKGFLNPKMTAVTDAAGEITDISLDYSESYEEQMLRYSKEYATL